MTIVRGEQGSVAARALAAAGLAALLLGGGLAVALALEESERAAGPDRTTGRGPETTPATRPPAVVRVPLSAVGALDPEGDGRENDEQAPLAVDGDARTAWATERYDSFFKAGVGLLLDAGERRRLRRVDVVTGTPGVRAEIRVGAAQDGPFRRVGSARALGTTTAFPLGGAGARYVVVWITEIPGGGAAEVAEVRLRASAS